MKHYLLLIFFGCSVFLNAQHTDFFHLKLHLDLDTNQRKLNGIVDMAFTAGSGMDSIYLNGMKLEYSQVLLNGNAVAYDFDDNGIWLKPTSKQLKDTNRISIEYSATPSRGIFFVGWQDETGLSKRQIWTQGQGIDHRHWIPYKDEQTDKLTTEIIVEFNSAYEVISNGELISKSTSLDNENETRWHYRMGKPHSGYLMMLAIGKYEKRETFSKSGVPLTQYYYPERENDYEWYYYGNEKIFNFLEEEIGIAYPWKNYKQVPVQDFQHGAMENTTATIFGDFFLVDEHAFNDRNYTFVNAHELAHQWFGNLVTADSSDNHWLHEGFATYYQWLSEENLYGKDFFDWERHKAAQLVFEAAAIDTVPLGNGKAGSNRFYQKGAWVLYMMNEQLGNENFKEVIKHYLKINAFGIVTTETFNNSIYEVTARNFDEFFEQWVYQPYEPVIEVSEERITDAELTLKISQKRLLSSSLRAQLELVYENDSTEIVPMVLIGESQELSYKLMKGTALKYWNFNPDMNILAKVTEVKSMEMWKAQMDDKELLDRYEAVVNLAPASLSEKEETLKSVVYREDEFFSVRAEALQQLLAAEHEKFETELLAALRSEDVQLQKEAIKMLKDADGEVLKTAEDLRSGNSYLLRENAISQTLDIEDPKENEWLKNDIFYLEPGFPGRNVEIAALLYRTAFLTDEQALDSLKFRTSSGFDFMTRMNAMTALAALKYFDHELVENYFDALFSRNRSLSGAALRHLKAYYKGERSKAVIKKYIKRNRKSWDDFRKRTVSRTFDLNLN